MMETSIRGRVGRTIRKTVVDSKKLDVHRKDASDLPALTQSVRQGRLQTSQGHCLMVHMMWDVNGRIGAMFGADLWTVSIVRIAGPSDRIDGVESDGVFR